MGDYYDNSFGYIRLGSRSYGKTQQLIKEAYEQGKKEGYQQSIEEIEKLKDLVDHLKNWCASPEDEAAAKAEEREQCCLDVCEWCRKARPFLPDTVAWHVPFVEGSGPLECRAYPIRRRAGQ